MTPNYEFGLERNGAIIDTTGLDENNPAHAADLFYTEFGHTRDAVDRILLLSADDATLTMHHNLPVRLTTDREDSIDWPVWVCACGCGDWGARW